MAWNIHTTTFEDIRTRNAVTRRMEEASEEYLYTPTVEEIAKKCASIRKSWSPEERMKRERWTYADLPWLEDIARYL